MKPKLFFFTSTRKSDKLSQITVATTTKRRAYALALMNFKSNGYKGSPKFLLVS